jgi:hypothetical protein
MTGEEQQHIEQRKFGITVAQVAQLVANHDGQADEYAANTARLAANRLALIVARERFTAQQLEQLEAIRIYLNRINLALTELDGCDYPTLVTLEGEQ